jgi:hypothetical protein
LAGSLAALLVVVVRAADEAGLVGLLLRVAADRADAVLGDADEDDLAAGADHVERAVRAEGKAGEGVEPLAVRLLLARFLDLLEDPVEGVDHRDDDDQPEQRAAQRAGARAGRATRLVDLVERKIQRLALLAFDSAARGRDRDLGVYEECSSGSRRRGEETLHGGVFASRFGGWRRDARSTSAFCPTALAPVGAFLARREGGAIAVAHEYYSAFARGDLDKACTYVARRLLPPAVVVVGMNVGPDTPPGARPSSPRPRARTRSSSPRAGDASSPSACRDD